MARIVSSNCARLELTKYSGPVARQVVRFDRPICAAEHLTGGGIPVDAAGEHLCPESKEGPPARYLDGLDSGQGRIPAAKEVLGQPGSL